MHATIRRYEGVDQNRTDELTQKVADRLAPQLSKLPAFAGYYLIEAGNGVMSSTGLFESVEQADQPTRLAAAWLRDEKLEMALPNSPVASSRSRWKAPSARSVNSPGASLVRWRGVAFAAGGAVEPQWRVVAFRLGVMDEGRQSQVSSNALLAAVEEAPPVDVLAAELAAAIDAREVSFLIADFSGRSLIRLGHSARPGVMAKRHRLTA